MPSVPKPGGRKGDLSHKGAGLNPCLCTHDGVDGPRDADSSR